MTKITELTKLGDTPADDDLLYVVDASETADANKSKAIAYSDLVPDVREVPETAARDVGRVLAVGSDQVPFWDEAADIVDPHVEAWARDGNTDPIPADKLPAIPAGNEAEVSALDYTVDTLSAGLSSLPALHVGAFADADAAAQTAGIAFGHWTQGQTPNAYSGVTWHSTPFTFTDTANRLIAVRLPSGLPPRVVRLRYTRGNQTNHLPPALNTQLEAWTITGVPDHYDVYHLTTGGNNFAALPIQNGDVVAIQVAAVSYDTSMADNAGRVPELRDDTTALARGLGDIHSLVSTVTTEVGSPGSFEDVTTAGHGTDIGYVASITNDATSDTFHHDNDGTYRVPSAASVVPVVWIPIGDEPARYQWRFSRGGSVIDTHPRNGEYWRAYRQGGNDAVIASVHDTYFLASESNDQPLTIGLQAGDQLQLRVGSATEQFDIPETALAAAVRTKLNASGGTAVPITAQRPYPLTAGSNRKQASTNPASSRLPITAIPETNPYATGTVSNNGFSLAAGLYDFFFGTSLYANSSGTALETDNDRVDRIITAHGTNVEYWQATNPYVRPIGSTGGAPYGDAGHIQLRVWVPATTTVHFEWQLDASTGGAGWLGVDTIDFMSLGGAQGPRGNPGAKGSGVTVTRLNPDGTQEDTSQSRPSRTVWRAAQILALESAVAAIANPADGDIAWARVAGTGPSDRVLKWTRAGSVWLPHADAFVSSSSRTGVLT